MRTEQVRDIDIPHKRVKITLKIEEELIHSFAFPVSKNYYCIMFLWQPEKGRWREDTVKTN